MATTRRRLTRILKKAVTDPETFLEELLETADASLESLKQRGSRRGADPASEGAEAGPRLRLGEDEGRRALLAEGVILSVAVEEDEPPPGYWAALLPEGSPRSALLLGLGGGTLAHLLARRYPEIRMVGVDVDAELIAFAREHFGLDLPNLEVVVADAFQYVERCERSFDFIAVDLFAGHQFQRGVLAKPFLRRLKAMADPGGEVVFNLFKDRYTDRRLERISRVLRMRRVEQVGRNVAVHCRA